MICLDEMGPESAKSFPGQQLVRCDPEPTTGAIARAVQEIDDGRRGKGYVFGAFQPATGEALTQAYGGRTIANWVDFLARVGPERSRRTGCHPRLSASTPCWTT